MRPLCTRFTFIQLQLLHMKNCFLFITILLISCQILSAQVQRAQLATADSKSIKPLDAKVLKLDRQGAAVLSTWVKAKEMMLLSSGHFVPLKYKSPQAQSASGSLPGGGPNSFADGGTNCAKIKCPDVFGPDVVCWECH